MSGYVPFDVRHGGDAWAGLEAALNRYFDAEEAALIAAMKMAAGSSDITKLSGEGE